MLLACGSNGRGQLGLGHTEDSSVWQEVPINLQGPISLAGGGNHTIIVEHGTGIAYMSQAEGFVSIEHPEGIEWKLGSAGWAFTVLVDAENCVWTCGTGPNGELGLGGLRASSLKKLGWTSPASVLSVKCGMSHVVICLADGSLWGWGASRKGQLNTSQAVVDYPVPVLDDIRPEEYSCGRDFTAVLKNKRLSILGNARLFGSAVMEFPKEKAVLTGWSTILLLPGGIMLGNNSHNQLNAPRQFDDITLGSEHGIFRCGERIGAWGWGEHGNCPPDQDFSGRLTVFAGCATSFIYCT